MYIFIEGCYKCQFSIDEHLEHLHDYISTYKTINSKLKAQYGDKVIIDS